MGNSNSKSKNEESDPSSEENKQKGSEPSSLELEKNSKDPVEIEENPSDKEKDDNSSEELYDDDFEPQEKLDELLFGDIKDDDEISQESSNLHVKGKQDLEGEEISEAEKILKLKEQIKSEALSQFNSSKYEKKEEKKKQENKSNRKRNIKKHKGSNKKQSNAGPMNNDKKSSKEQFIEIKNKSLKSKVEKSSENKQIKKEQIQNSNIKKVPVKDEKKDNDRIKIDEVNQKEEVKENSIKSNDSSKETDPKESKKITEKKQENQPNEWVEQSKIVLKQGIEQTKKGWNKFRKKTMKGLQNFGDQIAKFSQDMVYDLKNRESPPKTRNELKNSEINKDSSSKDKINSEPKNEKTDVKSDELSGDSKISKEEIKQNEEESIKPSEIKRNPLFQPPESFESTQITNSSQSTQSIKSTNKTDVGEKDYAHALRAKSSALEFIQAQIDAGNIDDLSTQKTYEQSSDDTLVSAPNSAVRQIEAIVNRHEEHKLNRTSIIEKYWLKQLSSLYLEYISIGINQDMIKKIKIKRMLNRVLENLKEKVIHNSIKTEIEKVYEYITPQNAFD